MPISAAPNASQLHNVQLNQNFGDSPVGRLGNSRVQSGPAGTPRTGTAAYAKTPTPGLSLGARILNAVTPQGVRAESKVRGGLMATSALVGDLLGALSKSSGHSVDGLSAKQLLDSLPQTAAPLTRRGADLDAVFSQRTAVHVKNMSTAQLLELRDGVALAQSSALDSSHGPALATVKNAVGRELTQRLLDTATQKMAPILAKLVAELPREAANPGAVAFAFNELQGAAFTVLTGHGESTLPANGANLAARKLELIKETLNTALDNGDIDPGHMGAILGNLSSEMLHSLDANSLDPSRPAESHLIGEEFPFAMDRLVHGAIGTRAEQTEAAFMQAADALLARTLPVADDPNGSLQNPQSFAKDVIAAATNLAKQREHGDICDLEFPEAMGEKSAQLLPHLDRLCSPGNLLVGALSHDQLSAFSKALTSLGVERGSGHVQAELSRRKDEESASFGTALLATCTAAQSGNPQALLHSLKAFSVASSNSVQAFQRLGEPINDADKVMQFRADQSTKALATLPPGQLGSLLTTLHSRKLLDLQASLAEMGQTLVQDDNMAAGKPLYDASQDLKSLSFLAGNALAMTSPVGDVLVSGGLSQPRMRDEARHGTATLDHDSRAAILAEFGVQAGTGGTVNVKAGVASPGFQQTFEANLRGMEARRSLLHTLPGGVQTGVHKQLWLDLPRANYAIKGADGATSVLINVDRIALSTLPDVERESLLMGAVGKLRDLTGANPALLLLVSEFACQTSMVGMMQGLGSADSPVRMPDGTAGTPMNGTESTAFSFESDGDDGVLMRIDYSIASPSHFMGSDGSSAALDPTASHFNASVELRFDSQLQVSVSDPVSFNYNLQVAEPAAAAEDAGPATPPATAATVTTAANLQPTAGAANLTAQAMQETLLEAIRAGVPGNELAANIGVARNEGRISGQEADFLLALIPASGEPGATAPLTAGVAGSAPPQAAASISAPALSRVAMGSFGADTPVSRQNNTIWQQATKTGDLAPLANHVHVPIQGSGFCFLTALAASRGVTTPQLIEQLKTSATGSATQTATLARILNEARNGSIDAEQADVTALLASAGLAINIHLFAEDGAHVLSPPPSSNAVDLMFRKGHFDLLMPAAGFDAATLTRLPNNYVLQGTIPANAELFAASSNA